ncbi:hypothetical protein F503_07078 [Ophiostoma piceae UAMH 11346]|uniref:Uncharacterized protein n=1 Tax=Ophiostoma piceae (strain UAMH 11346) TaxID=1262450 RepID=S3C8Y3_OPHP1|nr:hypothetical protein F503_07078 [Ophiostoma piceae UAMH 11346]
MICCPSSTSPPSAIDEKHTSSYPGSPFSDRTIKSRASSGISTPPIRNATYGAVALQSTAVDGRRRVRRHKVGRCAAVDNRLELGRVRLERRRCQRRCRAAVHNLDGRGVEGGLAVVGLRLRRLDRHARKAALVIPRRHQPAQCQHARVRPVRRAPRHTVDREREHGRQSLRDEAREKGTVLRRPAAGGTVPARRHRRIAHPQQPRRHAVAGPRCRLDQRDLLLRHRQRAHRDRGPHHAAVERHHLGKVADGKFLRRDVGVVAGCRVVEPAKVALGLASVAAAHEIVRHGKRVRAARVDVADKRLPGRGRAGLVAPCDIDDRVHAAEDGVCRRIAVALRASLCAAVPRPHRARQDVWARMGSELQLPVQGRFGNRKTGIGKEVLGARRKAARGSALPAKSQEQEA